MNILYATDGSACAAIAERLLAKLPLTAGARVTVLSAVPESNWAAALPLESSMAGEGCLYSVIADIAAEERAGVCETVKAAAARLRELGPTVAACVRRQAPAQAILEQAREDQAELIVMGSHGKGAGTRRAGGERLLIGSVSERVARYAHCSVLVARGDSLARAILAVDGSESAARALDAFVRLPLPPALELLLVHVRRPGASPAPAPGSDPSEALLQRAQARLREAGREAAAERRCGVPADELVAAARQTGADLIVVGAANRSALGHLFLGSVSSRVLSHAPCSVLVAR